MNTKKTIAVSIIASFLLVGASAFAEETGDQSKKQDRSDKSEMKDRKFRIMENTPPFRWASSTLQKREEVKGKLRTERNKNIVERVNNFIDKLGKNVDRLIAIGTKLENRMNTMEASGVDLTQSEELLAQFKEKIEQAKTDIASAGDEVDGILSGEIKTDTGGKVREALKKAEESVRAAHRALVATIVSVKSKVKDERGERNNDASTTSRGEN